MAFSAQPPDLHRLSLGRQSFAALGPLALLGNASYPVPVRRLADSLAPSFSPPLTVGTLGFTWIVTTYSPENSHLQVTCHAGHTEEAISAAIALSPAYLGVVASKKRFLQLRDVLAAQDVDATNIDAIHTPAGLDIGAVTPEEIAISILAEIVQQSRARHEAGSVPDSQAVLAEHQDPVCGMPVDADTTRHTAELSGRTYYFCCGSCRERFVKEPETFAATSGAGEAS